MMIFGEQKSKYDRTISLSSIIMA